MSKNASRNHWIGVVSLLGILVVLSALNMWRQAAKVPADDERAANERVMAQHGVTVNDSARFSLSPAEDLAIVGQGKGLCWMSSFSNQTYTRKTPQDLTFIDELDQCVFTGNGRRLIILGEHKGHARIGLMDAQSHECKSICPITRTSALPTLRVSHKGDYLAMRTTEFGIHPSGMEAIAIRETKSFQLTGSVLVPVSAAIVDFNVTEDCLNYAYSLAPNHSEMQIYTMSLRGNDTSLRCTLRSPGHSRFESARFSLLGDRLVVSRLFDEPLRVYGLPNGELLSELPSPTLFPNNGKFGGFAISQDGKTLATANPSGMITIWDVTVNPAHKMCELKDSRAQKCSYLNFGHDGSTVVAIMDKSIIVWDINDRAMKKKHDRLLD